MATEPAKRHGPKIPFPQTIGARLGLLVVVLILVTIISMSIINYRTVRGSILDEVHVGLQLQNDSVREILESEINYQHSRIDAVANQILIRDNLTAFAEGHMNEEELQANTLQALVDIRHFSPDIQRILILSEEGTVVASTDLAVLGESMVDDPQFTQGKVQRYLGMLRLMDEPQVAWLSGPVRNDLGEVVGVVIAEFESGYLRETIGVVKNSHETASVRVGVPVGDGRFRYLLVTGQDDIDELPVEADAAMALAVAGESGFLDDIFDHRDIEVVAAYRPLAIQDVVWGLVSQVDAREIYTPVRYVFWVVLITAVLFTTTAVLFAVLFVRRSLTPIHDLAESTGRLKPEDSQLDIEVEAKDEFGVLGQAFNEILKERAKYTQTLQDQVQNRTEELAAANVGLERIIQRVESQNDLMERDLRRAEIFQKSLLPKAIPDMRGFSLAALYLPGNAVGGDLYDVMQIDSDHFVLLIADSAGHGASAAMLSVLFKLRLESPYAQEYLAPSTVFDRINRDFVEDLAAPGVFVTALMVVLNVRTREVTMSSAGHPPLLLVRKNGDVVRLPRTGPGLGLSLNATYRDRRFNLVEGDQLLLYTDGLFDVGDRTPPSLDNLAFTLNSPSEAKPVLEQLFDLGSGSVELEDRDDVTLCLLTASSQSNWIRTGSRSGSGAVESAGSGSNGKVRVEYAETETSTYLFLNGRVTWTYGEAFFDAATSVLDEGRPIVIEFKHCEYLDSAMLGTLHEVVERATRIDLDVKLQNVAESVKETFVELGLGDVLNHIIAEPVWTPESGKPLLVSGRLMHNTRVIQAHDALAQINETNRETFGQVVDELRADFHGLEDGS